MRLFNYLAMALLVTSSTTAYAGGDCGSGYEPVDVVQHIFNTADQDEDGLLTQIEYEDAGLQVYGVTFEESDLDADGATSIQEYMLLYEFHHPVDGETEV